MGRLVFKESYLALLNRLYVGRKFKITRFSAVYLINSISSDLYLIIHYEIDRGNGPKFDSSSIELSLKEFYSKKEIVWLS